MNTSPGANLSSRGPGALRTLRELKGLTQSSLAQRSGVSVRTIRLLENGKIESPRISTLDALASAAQLSPAEAVSFRRAWRAGDELKPFSSLGEQGAVVDQLLAEARFHRGSDSRTLSATERIVIGADRLTKVSETERVLLALRGELSRSVSVVTGDQANDVCVEEFEAVHGCRLLDTISVEEQNLRIYYLEVDPPASPGEQRLVSYRRRAASGGRALADSDGNLYGSIRRTPVARVDAYFEGERPARIWELERLPDAEDFTWVRDLALDSSGFASITRLNLPAGHSCGLMWEW